jgi:hypothetical protein
VNCGDRKSVPDSDHVVRYAKPSWVARDGSGRETVAGDVFFYTEPDGASANWLECFNPPLDNQLHEVRKRARITYKTNGRLVRVKVATLKQSLDAFEGFKGAVNVLHDPLLADVQWAEDPSHALIVGVPTGNDPAAELARDFLAQCVLDVWPAKS